jgi:hypothetical protein
MTNLATISGDGSTGLCIDLNQGPAILRATPAWIRDS